MPQNELPNGYIELTRGDGTKLLVRASAITTVCEYTDPSAGRVIHSNPPKFKSTVQIGGSEQYFRETYEEVLDLLRG